MSVIPMPSRTEVHLKLKDLASGIITPEEASTWAEPWDEKREGYEEMVSDYVVWIGLNKLYASYAFEAPNTPMYDRSYFKEWLKKFEEASKINPLPGEIIDSTKKASKLLKQNELPVGFPTRQEVRDRLLSLLSKNPYTITFASQWAVTFILFLDENNADLEDTALSKGLRHLFWADMPSITEPRKFTHEDYVQWLEEFDKECSENPV